MQSKKDVKLVSKYYISYLIAILCFLTFNLALFFSAKILTRQIEKLIAYQIKSITGYKIEYDKLYPFFLYSLKLENLRLKSIDGSQDLKINEVKITLNFLSFLSSSEENLILNTKLNGGLFKIKAQSSSSSSNEDFKSSLLNFTQRFERFNIKFNNIKVLLENDFAEFRSTLNNFVLRSKQDEILLSGFLNFKLTTKEPSFINGFNSNIFLEGRLKDNLDFAYLNVGFRKFENDKISLLSQYYQVNYTSEYIKIFNSSQPNLELNFNLDLKSRNFRLDLLFLELNLKDWIKFNGVYSKYNDYLDSSFVGQFSLLYDIDKNDLRYASNLEIKSLFEEVKRELSGITFKAKGNQNLFNVYNLDFKFKRGYVNYRGIYSLKDFLPRGTLSFNSLKIADYPSISGNLISFSQNNNFIINSTNLKIANLKVNNLNFVNSFSKEKTLLKYTLELLDFSQINFDATLTEKNTLLNLNVSKLPLLYIYDIVPQRWQYISFSNFSSLFLNFNGLLNINNKNILKSSVDKFIVDVYSNKDSTRFLIDLLGREKYYKMKGYHISENETKVDYEMDLNLNDNGFKGLSTLFYQENKYSFSSLLNLKDKNFSLEFNNQGNLKVNYSENKYLFNILLNDFTLKESYFNYIFNTKVDLEFKKDNILESLYISAPYFNFEKFNIESNKKVLNFSFSSIYSRNNLSINKINLNANYFNLIGSGNFNHKNTLSTLNGSLNLYSSSNKERYFLGASSKDDILYLLLKFQGMNIKNLSSFPFTAGELAGDFFLTFAKDDKIPSVTGELNFNELMFIDNKINGSLSLGLLENKLSLYNINFYSNNKNILNGIVRYDLDESFGILNLDFKTKTLNTKIDGFLKTKSEFSLSDFGFLEVLTNGELNFKDVIFNGSQISNLSLDFMSNWNKILLKTVSQDVSKFEYIYSSQSFFIEIAEYFPISFVSSGFIKNGTIDGRVDNIKLDSRPFNLKKIYEIEELGVLYDLVLSGNLKLKGDLSNPKISGLLEAQTLKASTVFLKTDTQFNTDRILNASNMLIELKDNRISFTNNFSIGSSTLNLDALFLLNFGVDYIIDFYKIDVKIWGSSGVPYSFDKAIVDSRGWLKGDLSISGNLSYVEIKGNLDISNTTMYLIDSSLVSLLLNPFLDKAVQSSLDNVMDFKIDLDIKTGSSVVFLWPDRSIKIVDANIDYNKIKIAMDSINGTYSFQGDVELKSGQISYNNQKFLFKKGNMIYFNENQNKFDPWLTLEATTTLLDKDEKILVTLLIDSPLSNLTPKFSSSPSRSESEINYLISTSIIPLGIREQGLIGPLENTGSLFFAGLSQYAISIISQTATDFLLKTIEDYIRLQLNLDFISIRTNFLGNVITTNLFRNSQLTFADILDDSSFKLGKFISDGVFIQGGFTFLKNPQSTLRSSLDFIGNVELEMNTPLFLITWGLDWNFTKISLSGLSNNIAISWKFTY